MIHSDTIASCYTVEGWKTNILSQRLPKVGMRLLSATSVTLFLKMVSNSRC